MNDSSFRASRSTPRVQDGSRPSEMVERVAKAIRRAEAKVSSARWRMKRTKREPYEAFKRRVELTCARAVLKAMREPTAGMCEAGSALSRCPPITTSQADEAWQAMIDAALGEP